MMSNIIAKIFGKGTCVGCSKKGNCKCDNLTMVFECKDRRKVRSDMGTRRVRAISTPSNPKECPFCHSLNVVRNEQASDIAQVGIYTCECGKSFNENDLIYGNNGEDIKNIQTEQEV